VRARPLVLLLAGACSIPLAACGGSVSYDAPPKSVPDLAVPSGTPAGTTSTPSTQSTTAPTTTSAAPTATTPQTGGQQAPAPATTTPATPQTGGQQAPSAGTTAPAATTPATPQTSDFCKQNPGAC